MRKPYPKGGSALKLSDDLKDARNRIELAINEENRRADARVSNSGRNYGLEARLRAEKEGEKGAEAHSGRS